MLKAGLNRVDPKRYMHVWDLEDKAAFIAHYKQRYEQPLIEIFES